MRERTDDAQESEALPREARERTPSTRAEERPEEAQARQPGGVQKRAREAKPGGKRKARSPSGVLRCGGAGLAARPAASVDFRVVLKQRAAARRARADQWRAGRRQRGKIRFSGYELCPFAEQVRLALAMSRQAYTFTEPSLPYWLVPDAEEQEYDGNEGPGKSNDDETSSAAESAAASTDPAAVLFNSRSMHSNSMPSSSLMVVSCCPAGKSFSTLTAFSKQALKY